VKGEIARRRKVRVCDEGVNCGDYECEGEEGSVGGGGMLDCGA